MTRRKTLLRPIAAFVALLFLSMGGAEALGAKACVHHAGGDHAGHGAHGAVTAASATGGHAHAGLAEGPPAPGALGTAEGLPATGAHGTVEGPPPTGTHATAGTGGAAAGTHPHAADAAASTDPHAQAHAHHAGGSDHAPHLPGSECDCGFHCVGVAGPVALDHAATVPASDAAVLVRTTPAPDAPAAPRIALLPYFLPWSAGPPTHS